MDVCKSEWQAMTLKSDDMDTKILQLEAKEREDNNRLNELRVILDELKESLEILETKV